MKKIIKRMAVICMAFVMMLSMMSVLGALTDGADGAQKVYADDSKPADDDNFKISIWPGDSGASVAVYGYKGTATEIILPDTATYEGKSYPASSSDNWWMLYDTTFKGNTTITKVAIPKGYDIINPETFYGCTALVEISIGALKPSEYGGIGANMFKGCTSLVTYNIDSSDMSAEKDAAKIKNAGIGVDLEGNPFGGVTVYTQEGSVVWNAILELNEGRPEGTKIALEPSDDPYARNTIAPTPTATYNVTITGGANASVSGKTTQTGLSGAMETVTYTANSGYEFKEFADISSNGITAKRTSSSVVTVSGTPTADASITVPDATKANVSQYGEDGTAYGKGATEDVVDSALTALGSEKDPKGTVFGLLQAKAKKAGKTSVTIGWKKAGAARFVVYGSPCGNGKKYVRLKETTGTSASFSSVAGTKVKKGTYYKFIVVAFDANNKVVSTSKTVHVATTGGKVGNDKDVKTAAKKNKVTLKKGKKFKLKAKEVPASKKLKVKRHRKVAYESSDPAVATVSSKGVIQCKKKGSCTVYAYAQNGVFKKIKVTVK